ncbi:pyridoxal-phosphate dependent enzyme [Pyxidicoccus fallax]|uniref:L-serine ammonia-lyase n=1 Tax=Pyxidicoccus fallax TaxID=394095 RepID=A0A848LEY9_9BACT|nr:pyridoxal-phosphate dependent enzyme [Pyxidicoccus fallax]NMO16984.1 pyridoxal-phosphate dependent enzyme [Pyxidicoccus fallax]NPC79017.1 pyridoxal-phosphate dependent enzyme [Pyxidicoccus fallax]
MTTLHIQTPLISHAPLSAAQGRDVLLKMESLQPSGSFKLRGIGLMCQRAVAGGATHIVCPSGGNAGFAAAVAGVALGVRTTIVVPETTAPSVRARIAAIGATLVVHGGVWDEANLEALRLCSEPGAIYVPPFDHADLWDGNATLIDEAVAQADAPFDAVICSVGGGGLLCGVLEGLHRNGLKHVPVVAVETEGAASFTESVRAGRLVTLPAITSIATTLGAKTVAQAALDWSAKHEIACVTVTDAQAVAACLALADDMRTLVEPACGAALAVVYENLPTVRRFKRPLVVVCGGIGVDLAKLAGWKSRFGL